jgi:benzoyl-CoA reductase subunit B
LTTRAIQRLNDEIALFRAGLDYLQQSEKPSAKLNLSVVQALIENNEHLVQSIEEGSPFIASYHAYGPEIMAAMDLPWYAIAATPVTTPPAVLQQQVQECDGMDIPADLCTVIRLALYQIENDFFPPPTAAIMMITPCDGTLILHQILKAREDGRGVPWFAPDPPYLDSERALDYYTRQFRDMVTFLERHTGRRLDFDRLREVIAESNRQYELWAEYNELRRAVPCPHGYRIGFQVWALVSMLWPGDPRCTAWLEDLVSQTADRVRQGLGAVPEERIRLFWYDLRPPWVHDFASWLEKEWGAVIIMDMVNYNPYTLIDMSTEETMLRGLAKRSMFDSIMVRQERGPAEIVSTDIPKVVKDYNIDCVVWPAHMGHKALAGTVGIGRELCRELGVPFLHLGLDLFDPRYTTPDEVKDRMSSFFTSMGW